MKRTLISLLAVALIPSVTSLASPNPVIETVGTTMTVTKPLFGVEAKLQASVLGKIAGVDEDQVAADLLAKRTANKVLIYTYAISPFSTEAISLLESTGYEFTQVELGVEWFLLGGEDSVKRVLLSQELDSGATSLPKIFIGGRCLGGYGLNKVVTTENRPEESDEDVVDLLEGGGVLSDGSVCSRTFALIILICSATASAAEDSRWSSALFARSSSLPSLSPSSSSGTFPPPPDTLTAGSVITSCRCGMLQESSDPSGRLPSTSPDVAVKDMRCMQQAAWAALHEDGIDALPDGLVSVSTMVAVQMLDLCDGMAPAVVHVLYDAASSSCDDVDPLAIRL